jgi:hypothetical protein
MYLKTNEKAAPLLTLHVIRGDRETERLTEGSYVRVNERRYS